MKLMESKHLFDNYQTGLSLRTATKLTEMFTENTGKSMLDSGGAYGRNWERNQGATLDLFWELPPATWEKGYGVTLNSWRYCFNRLSYTDTAEQLTEQFRKWEQEDYDNRNPWSCLDQETYLEEIGAENLRGFNTYNWETNLGQVLQGYEFTLKDDPWVLLQVHGGCDVRGGYTRPAFFVPCCEYWLHQADCYQLECANCETYFTIRSVDVQDSDGCLLDDSLDDGCVRCGGDLTATAETGCY